MSRLDIHLSGTDTEADGGCRINNMSPPGTHVATPLQDLCDELHTLLVQCKPDNLITYTLQSSAHLENIVNML